MQFEVKAWAKFPGTCTECHLKFPENALIWYHTHRKTCRHVKCPQGQREKDGMEENTNAKDANSSISYISK